MGFVCCFCFPRNEKYNIHNINKIGYIPCLTQQLMVTLKLYFHVMTCSKLSAVPLTYQKHYTGGGISLHKHI